jgi:hypothetical protein
MQKTQINGHIYSFDFQPPIWTQAGSLQISECTNCLAPLQYKHIEWTNILHVAKPNGYPLSIITEWTQHTHIQQKLSGPQTTNERASKRKLWTTFTFYSPTIRKVTILFQDTDLKITFCTSNTIFNILNTHNHSTNIHTVAYINWYATHASVHTCDRLAEHWKPDTKKTH